MSLKSVIATLCLACLTLVETSQCFAHALPPSSVVVTELSDDRFEIRWKLSTDSPQPNIEAIRFSIEPGCRLPEIRKFEIGESFLDREYSVACDGGETEGRQIRFSGLSIAKYSVVIRLVRTDKTDIIKVISASKSTLDLGGNRYGASGAYRYVQLGASHISGGIDHLAFVFCLILICGGNMRRLLIGVSSFTLAHSVTLSLSAIGVVKLPTIPVEALIALSILQLAVVALRRIRSVGPVNFSFGFVVLVFVFGLMHGLGFAGALADIGLPRNDLLWSLAAFNVGVEIGQIAFVVLVLLISKVALVSLSSMAESNIRFPASSVLIQHTQQLSVCAVGVWAAFILIERLTAFAT